jgi:putative nucleotidyltransferase with HDIG domain
MTRALSGRHHPPARVSFFRSLGKRLNWLYTREIVAQAGFVGLLTAVAVILAFPTPTDYQVGDVAEDTIRADRGFRLVDSTATELQQREAAARVVPVFVLDDVLGNLLEEEAGELFRRGRELLAGSAAGPSGPEEEPRRQEELDKLETAFARTFNLDRDSRAWELLIKRQFSVDVERQVLSLATEVMGQGLLDRPNPFGGQRSRQASVIILSTRAEYTAPVAAALLDLDSANRFLEIRARALKARFSQEDIALILALARGLMQPNLKPEPRETEKRLAEARSSAPVAYFNIRAGEVIVREGTIISPEAIEKIKIMNSFAGTHEWVLRFIGLFVVLFVFLNSALILSHIGPRARFKPIPVKEQAFLILLLLLAALLAHSSQMFGSSLAWDFDFLDSRTVFYAMPIPTAAMLVAIFFGVRKAAFTALFAAVIAAVVTPGGGRFMAMLYCYNGAIAATWCLRNMNERGHLIPASFWVMVVNCVTLLGLTLLSDAQWSRQTVYNFCAAAFCGALSGIIASGMIPLIEMAFGFNTNLKMMELGNLDRPMLRDLMLSAPGTYHHSVIVGAMVEAAAEAIGANPHLAKVGAYYHDIGKMKKPLYFVENQTGENRHDTLAPSMSALILIGHVREGAELARQNGLPQSIIDIVDQHHGTSLMSFFYHKAKEQRQEGQPEVNEGDYRYPGPRPRSREAGLVMLADICEAATRSLSEPTPAKIKNMVRQLVNSVFNDGQLDDCELQGREIAELIGTFTTILIGIYHHRVAYPGARKSLVEEKRDLKGAPGAKSETGREIYGHLSVEPPKSPAH